jgi:DNA-binding beta-propeller fold protein YncE
VVGLKWAWFHDSGRGVAIVPIGKGPDAVAFDPDKNLIVSSNGQDGTLTVIKEVSGDKFSVVETVPHREERAHASFGQ